MLTSEQVESLKLGIAPIDDRVCLIVESAFDWIEENTTLEIDVDNEETIKALPACVRLFIMRFFDVMVMTAGVQSESIESLSQTYSQSSKEDLIWDIANSLLSNYLKSRVRFVAAQKRYI